MKRVAHWWGGLLALWLTASCSVLPLYSHKNVSKAEPETLQIDHNPEVPSGAAVASENVPWTIDPACRNGLTVSLEARVFQHRGDCPTEDRNFVAVAISGGGSRAAVFSAQILFELQRYGILQQVDVLSSVSGGSYTAAFYGLSCDDAQRNCPDTVEGPGRFEWKEEPVFDLLQRNYVQRWVLNWFWPDNMARYWLTYYDRTDIMAETLSDNLFDNSYLGNEGFLFRDLNPQRPNLLINATNNTTGNWVCEGEAPDDRLAFTFTQEMFDCLHSDLDRYPVANAVTASAAFPGVFNYVTLGNYALDTSDTSPRSYIHLFDGGTSDNLGLTALQRIVLREQLNRRENVHTMVIIIDAFVPTVSKPHTEAEPRSGLDYVLDSNFLSAYDTLMERIRKDKICGLRRLLDGTDGKGSERVIHFTFELFNPHRDRTLCEGDIAFEPTGEHRDLYALISGIPTNLKIGDGEAACLRFAAMEMVERSMGTIRRVHNPALHISARPTPPPGDEPRLACLAYMELLKSLPPPDFGK